MCCELQANRRGTRGWLLGYLAVERRHRVALDEAYLISPFLRQERMRSKNLMRGCLDRFVSGLLGVLIGLTHCRHQHLVLGIGDAKFASGAPSHHAQLPPATSMH